MSREDFFDRFDEHTLLKHLILEKYLKAWAMKLLQWRKAGHRVWFIDAFAGEGKDNAGNPGSPLIAAQIASDITSELRHRIAKATVMVLATEIDPKRHGKLAKLMEPYTSAPGQLVHIRCGTLAERIDNFMDYVQDEPALFFLDPWGVEGLLKELLPKVLSGPHNEILLLFSDLGALRLHGVLASEVRNVEEELEELLRQPSLFYEHDIEKEKQLTEEVERSTKALEATKPIARRILAEAFSDEDLADLDRTPKDKRQLKLLQIYVRLLGDAGAKHIITLPMRNVKSQHVYHLVHCSKSKQGFRTMKEAMSEALTASVLPDDVRHAMRFDMAADVEHVVQYIVNEFAGEETRWSERKRARTVRNCALECTPIFPYQLDELKTALEQESYVLNRRPLTYRFPSASQ